jgi:hypothetical protein
MRRITRFRPAPFLLCTEILSCFFVAFFFSCATAVNGAGTLLTGAAFRETTLEVWRAEQGGPFGRGLAIRRVRRGKDGREYLLVTPRAFPTLILRAGTGREAGRADLEAAEFLAPGRDGHNEWRRGMAGSILFGDNGYSAWFALAPGVEALDLEAGGIRRGGSRPRQEEALAALRRRDERITALVRWMKETGGREATPRSFQDSGAFERYWTPVLFPELVRAKKRPALWRTVSASSARHRGEDVTWNSAYTALLFPEELRAARDTGALLRDWEEALEWVWLEFEWEYIIESLTGETVFSEHAVRLTKE